MDDQTKMAVFSIGLLAPVILSATLGWLYATWRSDPRHNVRWVLSGVAVCWLGISFIFWAETGSFFNRFMMWAGIVPLAGLLVISLFHRIAIDQMERETKDFGTQLNG